MAGAAALASLLGRLADRGRCIGRDALGLDTNPVPAAWTHVTKVDPEHDKHLPLVWPRYLAHTDAVVVGGSRAVTEANTVATFDLLAPLSVPLVHEPSAAAHVTDATRRRASFLAIPEVLNGDHDAFVGTLGEGIQHLRDDVVPEQLGSASPWLPAGFRDRLAALGTSWVLSSAIFEAYLVQNPDSAAARAAGVTADDVLSPEAATHRALAAEHRLESELVYVEYSGTFGGREAAAVVEAIDAGRSWSRLWYGGGLDSRSRARQMLDAGADTLVVGDVFHEIASEEAQLAGAVAEAFTSVPTEPTIVDWLAAREQSSAATRFLSTIPAVERPERRGRAYLAEGIRAWLALRALSESLPPDPTAADIGRAVSRRGLLPGESAFEDCVDRPRDLARRVTLCLLGRGAGVDVGDLPPATFADGLTVA